MIMTNLKLYQLLVVLVKLYEKALGLVLIS